VLFPKYATFTFVGSTDKAGGYESRNHHEQHDYCHSPRGLSEEALEEQDQDIDLLPSG
jgi:hypothetical protein